MLEQGRSGSDFFQEALPSREEEERISQFLREGNPTRLNAFNDFLLLETARDEVIAYKQQPEAVQILFNQRYARQIVRIPLLEEQINFHMRRNSSYEREYKATKELAGALLGGGLIFGLDDFSRRRKTVHYKMDYVGKAHRPATE